MEMFKENRDNFYTCLQKLYLIEDIVLWELIYLIMGIDIGHQETPGQVEENIVKENFT